MTPCLLPSEGVCLHTRVTRTSLPTVGLVSLTGQRKHNPLCGCSVGSLLSQLYSAPLPDMLPDDISPAALWEALESNPSALRAAHAAETHRQQPQELCLCLKMSSGRGSWTQRTSVREICLGRNKVLDQRQENNLFHWRGQHCLIIYNSCLGFNTTLFKQRPGAGFCPGLF